LKAPIRDGDWERGGPTTASCGAGGRHRAPARRCSCGLYAEHLTAECCAARFHEAQQAARSSGPHVDVVGIVEAWGVVELSRDGFRAEHARPLALLLPAGATNGYTRCLRRLAKGHGAEVWEVDGATELHVRCVERELGLDEGAIEELLGPELRRHDAARRRHERFRRTRAALADFAAMAGGLLVTGIFPLLIVASIVAALLDGDDGDTAALPPRDPRLQVLEQTFIEVDGDDLYVAIVRNRSRSRSALRVRPEGEFLDDLGDPVAWPDDPWDVENRPSLAPGETGIVYDYLSAYESVADQVKRIRIRLVARRWVTGAAPAPIAVVSQPRLDRRTCLLEAVVRSRRRRLEAELTGVSRDRRGHITAAGTWLAGPLPRGRSNQVLGRLDPRPCVHGRTKFEAYANPGPGELTPKPAAKRP
jgi:hypothetical protein